MTSLTMHDIVDRIFAKARDLAQQVPPQEEFAQKFLAFFYAALVERKLSFFDELLPRLRALDSSDQGTAQTVWSMLYYASSHLPSAADDNEDVLLWVPLLVSVKPHGKSPFLHQVARQSLAKEMANAFSDAQLIDYHYQMFLPQAPAWLPQVPQTPLEDFFLLQEWSQKAKDPHQTIFPNRIEPFPDADDYLAVPMLLPILFRDDQSETELKLDSTQFTLAPGDPEPQQQTAWTTFATALTKSFPSLQFLYGNFPAPKHVALLHLCNAYTTITSPPPDQVAAIAHESAIIKPLAYLDSVTLWSITISGESELSWNLLSPSDFSAASLLKNLSARLPNLTAENPETDLSSLPAITLADLCVTLAPPDGEGSA